MVQSKTDLFPAKLQQRAAMFRALGHPARLSILEYLAKTRTCITGDISAELPLSRTTVNQHLNELKKLHLIRGEISGVCTNYCLNPGAMADLSDMMNEIAGEIETYKSLTC